MTALANLFMWAGVLSIALLADKFWVRSERPPLAERYFQASIEFKDRVLSESTDTLENSIKALARTVVFARWWDSVLVDKIYAECTSEQYKSLKDIWQKREEARANHLARLSQEKSNNPHGDEVPVPDPRTAHQHQFFMFYEPRHDDTKD